MYCSNCGQKLGADENFCKKCGASASGENQYTVRSETTQTNYLPSSIGVRFLNFVLDRILSVILFFIIIFVFVAISPDISDSPILTLFSLSFFILYSLIFEAVWQRTPAKWITRTKVVTRSGGKPSFTTILGRTLARMIPFEPLSYLVSPIGWHDNLSHTLVVPSDYTETMVQQIKVEKKGGKVLIIAISVLVGIVILGLLASVALLALNSARGKARDARRVADIRQLSTALELYYNDLSEYPSSLNLLAPKYIDAIPSAPTPNEDACSALENTYTYALKNKDSYTLSFCLGDATGGYQRGVHTLTENGVDSPSSEESTPAITDQDNPNINQSDTTAEADYQEGYKTGFRDGQVSSAKFGENYLSPATKEREASYAEGYKTGFLEGCEEGGFDCSEIENYLNSIQPQLR